MQSSCLLSYSRFSSDLALWRRRNYLVMYCCSSLVAPDYGYGMCTSFLGILLPTKWRAPYGCNVSPHFLPYSRYCPALSWTSSSRAAVRSSDLHGPPLRGGSIYAVKGASSERTVASPWPWPCPFSASRTRRSLPEGRNGLQTRCRYAGEMVKEAWLNGEGSSVSVRWSSRLLDGDSYT